MTTLNDIIDAAQGLPSSERAQLIHALWNSISPEDWAPPNDDWLSEAQRRSKALDEGQMTTSPWSEVRERVRRKVGLDD
jgi:putative addiction module component (TIGR02574 family)